MSYFKLFIKAIQEIVKVIEDNVNSMKENMVGEMGGSGES
jgi:hypothetical protein